MPPPYLNPQQTPETDISILKKSRYRKIKWPYKSHTEAPGRLLLPEKKLFPILLLCGKIHKVAAEFYLFLTQCVLTNGYYKCNLLANSIFVDSFFSF